MCLFQEYSGEKFGDEVTITSRWSAPLRFRCWNCKLHPEGRGHFTTTSKDDELLAYEQITRHVYEHEQAGHRIHPCVGLLFHGIYSRLA
jgi:hypothetical protein